MNTIRLEWPTWDAFVRQAADTKLRAWSRATVTSDATHDADWRGFASFEAAVDAAIHGWPEGRQYLSDALDAVKPSYPLRSDRFDVAGAYPVVPRFVAGDPMSMCQPGRGAVSAKPVLRINYVGGAPVVTPAQAIINRGAALLSYVDALEARGHSVELTVARRTVAPNGQCRIEGIVPLKAAGAALDLNRAAFALVSPAMHRRLWFAIIEQHAALERPFGRGHGCTNTDPFDLGGGVITVAGARDSDMQPAAAKLAVEIAFEKYLYDNGRAAA